jgi:hypothetical protein
MPYIDRDQAGNIVGIYANAQRPDHEWAESAELWVPQPTQAQLIAATLAKARQMRLDIFKVLDGLQVSALVNADTTLAQQIEASKQALRDLPGSVDLSQCTTQQQMEGVVLQAYQAIVLAAPPEIKSAFDSLKP